MIIVTHYLFKLEEQNYPCSILESDVRLQYFSLMPCEAACDLTYLILNVRMAAHKLKIFN
ncbi:hypothetical protein HW44_07950 [Nitrosococcus oceani]|nr:hypothetical protein HW44_07950 [Nitrosococcus oceani]